MSRAYVLVALMPAAVLAGAWQIVPYVPGLLRWLWERIQ